MYQDKSFRRYLRDEEGSVLVEFVFMLPWLIWTWIALAVFWDTFRTINTAQKAAYSISDLISRQEDNVTDAYLDGMHDIFEYLMLGSSSDVQLRITSFAYDESEDEYLLIFSETSDPVKMPELTEAQLQTLKPRIPLMGDTDSAVLVETSVRYSFPFRIPMISDNGILNVDADSPVTVFNFDEFVVTRPRFKSYICLQSDGCPTLF